MTAFNNVPAYQGRLQLPVRPESDWESENPRLKLGEIVISSFPNNVRKFKVGTGLAFWSECPYYDAGDGAYKGFATTGITPPTNEGRIWYFATPGTYTNFLDVTATAITVTANLAILSYTGAYWEKHDIITGGFDTGWGALQGKALTDTTTVEDQGNVWWFAGPGPAVYTNFLDVASDPIVVNAGEELVILRFNGTYHIKTVILSSNLAFNRRIITVAPGVGVGNYVDVKDALNAIFIGSDYDPATEDDQIDIFIAPGTYTNQFVTITGVPFNGLWIPAYVNLVGSSKDTTIIRGPESATSGAYGDYATIAQIQGKTKISNLTIEAFKSKCCVNSTYLGLGPVRDLDVTFENCNFKHYGGVYTGPVNVSPVDIYLELLYTQKFNFIDCIFQGGILQLRNGDSLVKRDEISDINVPPFASVPQSGFRCNFKGCEIGQLQYIDNLCYNDDVISLTACNVDEITLSSDDTLFLAESGNFNAGNLYDTPPALTKFQFTSGNIGIISPDSDWLKANEYRVLYVPDHMAYGTNETGTTCAYGMLVTEVLPRLLQQQNGVLYDKVNYKRFIRHTGTNLRLSMGVVEDSIIPPQANSRNKWAIRHKGCCRILLDQLTSISAGDLLMASTSTAGTVTLWTAGNHVVGVALETFASGGTPKTYILAELRLGK